MLKGFRLSLSRLVPFVTFATLLVSGCGGSSEDAPPDQEGPTASQPLSDQAQLLVDQGNASQREGRYTDALDSFSQALDIHPDHPVPQFGSLLAAMALGDTALTQSLREKLEVSGPELLEMLGPGTGMGATAPGASHLPEEVLPEGHPTLEEEEQVDTLRPETGRRG